jgi:hypothetical protein
MFIAVIAESTHPICASLNHPLLACGGKRVPHPSLSKGEGGKND